MKKLYPILVFTFLFCIKGFCQDPVVTKKTIHIIPSADFKPADDVHGKIIPRDQTPIHSCEISKDKKTAVVTTLPAAGKNSQKVPEVKEEKK